MNSRKKFFSFGSDVPTYDTNRRLCFGTDSVIGDPAMAKTSDPHYEAE